MTEKFWNQFSLGNIWPDKPESEIPELYSDVPSQIHSGNSSTIHTETALDAGYKSLLHPTAKRLGQFPCFLESPYIKGYSRVIRQFRSAASTQNLNVLSS